MILFRWAIVEAYVIPSPSMEPTLRVGDYLLVSKLSYGPITPQTPLQVPLTHQRLPVLGTPSYSSAVQLPPYRLPGFGPIQRNDVVVFHVPNEPRFPPDLRTNYIKRCVAVAGDTLQIRAGQVVVNGQPQTTPTQATYFLAVAVPTEDVGRDLHAHGVVDYDQPDGVPVPGTDPYTGQLGYLISCPPDVAAYLRRQPYVQSLALVVPQVALFPDMADFGVSGAMSAVLRRWTLINYGPLPVPKKGQVITLTPANAAIYYKIISQYEPNKGVTWNGNTGMIMQQGRPLTSYTIGQNYYFMMGDNRLNSEDSRFWGFVPETYVVGKATVVWLALDPFTSQWHWERMFKAVR